ncbi:MAG: Zn-ribbon domain-containing OB-fold protein [Gammaproteobacteria bacterium]|nr:Zn-ribbon domain-containing OB-fold protein [Gammaproteobacteria bacterium]
MNGKPLPPINPATQPFWDACAQGRLLLQRCGDCGHLQLYPRLLCAACGSRTLGWVEASGRGTVKTFTIIRRAVSAAFEPDAPYVVALVELEEGPTLMSNIIGRDPASVAIGQPVRVTFEARGEGIAVPQFEPAA